LEEAEAARARGRPDGYGQVTGYAATFDPRPGRGRSPALTRVAELALADAGILPDDVDVVFADAYGVTELDRQEAETLITLFGPYGVPVTAPKTMTGRINAGAGALDVATALLTIREGVIPPTVGVTKLASGCEIDLVRGRARSADLTNALVLARGHGGFNAAVVVRGTPRGQ
jgi:act minimal PKS chain-length factor (CLF/KS beta)